MKHQFIRFIIIIFLFFCFCFLFLTKSYASEGYYISHELGSESAMGFLYFQPENANTPPGTTITYQFAGSNNNFSMWTKPESATDKIDLAKFKELEGSRYLKVKINFTNDSRETPSLEGYKILVKMPVGSDEVISSIPKSTGQALPKAIAKGIEDIKKSLEKLSLEKNLLSGKLVWFNLIIATIVGIIFIIIFFRLRISLKISRGDIDDHKR